MGRIVRIEFYEETRDGSLELRFKECEELRPQLRSIVRSAYDDLYDRAMPIESYRMSNGNNVAVAQRIRRLYYRDAAECGVSDANIYIFKS